MDIFAMVLHLQLKQRFDDGWRMLKRHWHARRTEGRLQRLQRQVRRIERRCASLQKRPRTRLGHDDVTGLRDRG